MGRRDTGTRGMTLPRQTEQWLLQRGAQRAASNAHHSQGGGEGSDPGGDSTLTAHAPLGSTGWRFHKPSWGGWGDSASFARWARRRTRVRRQAEAEGGERARPHRHCICRSGVGGLERVLRGELSPDLCQTPYRQTSKVLQVRKASEDRQTEDRSDGGSPDQGR